MNATFTPASAGVLTLRGNYRETTPECVQIGDVLVGKHIPTVYVVSSVKPEMRAIDLCTGINGYFAHPPRLFRVFTPAN